MEWKQREMKARVWVENEMVWVGKPPTRKEILRPLKEGRLIYIDNPESNPDRLVLEGGGGYWSLSDGGGPHEGETFHYDALTWTIGRKDKNGKEIYEGDIGRDASGTLAVIQYQFPSFVAMVKGKPWDINDKSDAERISCIEVIGNIFENPELLADYE